jgi:Na+/phosphate symporter
MDSTILSLLAQIPLVGIFVWFVLEMMKRYSAEQTERDNQWRTFLRELREAQDRSLTLLAKEINDMACQVASMKDTLNRHEINTEKRFSSLKRKDIGEE